MKSNISLLGALAAAAIVWVATPLLGQNNEPAAVRPAPRPSFPPAAQPAVGAANKLEQVKVFSLKNAEASATVEQLKQLLVDAKDLKIVGDARSNQILVHGADNDLAVVEALIRQLDSAETRKQPAINGQVQFFAPANPWGGVAAGVVRPEPARLNEQMAAAQKRADGTATLIKQLTDRLAAAQAKAGEGGDPKLDIDELQAQLDAAKSEHGAIEKMLKDLAEQRQAAAAGGAGAVDPFGGAPAGGGGGARGGFGGGGFGAQAGNQFGGLFGGAGGGGGVGGGGGFGGAGGAQFQLQAGGVPGQAEAMFVDGNNVTRWVVAGNGQPVEVTTTSAKQRQAEQAINNLAAQLQLLKKLEQPTDAQKAQMDDLKAQLSEKLDEQFKETQKAQFDEVAKLRERLDNLQKEITDRNKNREEILSQRLDDILSGKAQIPATPAAAARRAVRAGAVNLVPAVPAPVPGAAGVVVDHAAAAVVPPPANPFGPVPGIPIAPAAPDTDIPAPAGDQPPAVTNAPKR